MMTMDFQQRYKQLNAEQKKAVDHIEGPVMVIAGPGTGKTELLSVRTANILSKTDSLPENILCLTFTDSGAAAMRERLVGIIGKDAYKVAIHTFHSFGTEVINQNREYFYRGASFKPADDLNRYEILRGIFDELDYKNPLASTMNGEYTHQPDVTKVIAELKRSGLTSDELLNILEADEAALDVAERLLSPLLEARVSAQTGSALAATLPELSRLAQDAETLFEITPLARAIYEGLEAAVTASQTEHPTKPISAWKKKWFVKNDQDKPIFKSRNIIAKLRAVSYVYYEYLNKMEQASLFDYDDMILQVVHALEVNDDLRFTLQEKYLYIMVDEFQDTNLAQMRILHALTDNPANEGSPNVLVVGDDDQAIYSFQGADISNILRFEELYPGAKLITLIENYRSGAPVIQTAREVIVQGSERLESVIEGLSKQLHAQANTATVELFHAPTVDSERHWLVKRVAEAIKKGTKPSDIAVLTRKHHEIQSLLPYFDDAGISVTYERQENLLDQPPIMALELLARVIIALSRGDHTAANALMPELLSHPAWKLEPKEIWELSVAAHDAHKRWLDMMVTMPRFLPIHSWLIEMATLTPHTALEPMIDHLIGRSEDEAIASSPFFDHYFAPEIIEDTPAQYLDCLAALRTIRSQLRDYRTDQTLNLESFIEFINLHRRLGTNLKVAQVSLDTQEGSVNLMTAHKSKGLEFDTVYIFNAVDNVWGEKALSRSRTVNYPENLPLASAAERSTADERLRLFYVAMTRAKRRLVMSYSDLNDSDKATLIASFLSESSLPVQEITAIGDGELVRAAELAWYAPLTEPTAELAQLLEPTLKQYKLSVTHLNAFIDLTRGGPQHFLLDHLLHFPSAKSPSASYGTAVHRTLQQAHIHLAATGERKPIEDVLQDFEGNLKDMRLEELDYHTYYQKGIEQLHIFLEKTYETFNAQQKTELNFAGQEVVLGEARLTGMIDVAEIDEKAKSMTVTDYKTGKPATNWKGSDEFEKIKLHKYRQQLMFYHLLAQHSRDYHRYEVTRGCLSFVEPTRSGEISILELSFEKEELERVARLIEAVWQRIVMLDLPDVSQYPATLKGIEAFEEALLDGSA